MKVCLLAVYGKKNSVSTCSIICYPIPFGGHCLILQMKILLENITYYHVRYWKSKSVLNYTENLLKFIRNNVLLTCLVISKARRKSYLILSYSSG